MPSLSASVPANKLKVMRPAPGKPVARPMPGQTAAGGASAASPGPAKGGGGGVSGIMRADGGTAANGWTPQTAAPPKLATGAGFQFRPRDTVGGPMVPGGGGDIQTAIKSLRGQLGMPMPSVEPGGGDGNPTAPTTSVSSPTQPAQPAWKQLADLGIGGQGSAADNRTKLAELLAARSGGVAAAPGGPAGIEPGNPSTGVPANPAVAAANPFIRRMPATVSDPSSMDDGTGGAALQGNRGPMGPGQPNAYLDILNRRGFGGFGGRGLNPMAAGAVQYAG